MKKVYIITFCISVLSIFSVSIILLMLMLPQQTQVSEVSVKEYEGIKLEEFKFENSKELNETNLIKDYSITMDDINNYKKNDLYNSGNSDPFSPSASAENLQTGTNTQNNTTTSNLDTGTTSNNDTSNTTTSAATIQKTTNSNGGVENPSSTNK